MPEPTILATSGGFKSSGRNLFQMEFNGLMRLALRLSGAETPRLCFLATATGDSELMLGASYAACSRENVRPSHLQLFGMPNVDDLASHLLAQDVIWVHGGSVANLLAVWRVHGVDEIMAEAWSRGVVLAGVSAGSICWHVGGPTDSFGPDLRVIDNGLGLVPFSNGVHYDNETLRRPTFHRGVASGELPAGYATEDGVGVLYRGTEFAGAFTEIEGKQAYFVHRDAATGKAVEQPVETELLT